LRERPGEQTDRAACNQPPVRGGEAPHTRRVDHRRATRGLGPLDRKPGCRRRSHALPQAWCPRTAGRRSLEARGKRMSVVPAAQMMLEEGVEDDEHVTT